MLPRNLSADARETATQFVIVLPRCLARRLARLSWALTAWCWGQLPSMM
jgi:hypothetical protein